MRSVAASVICLMLSAASASAQDCGPFFWLCQRPPGAQVQPNLPNERPNPRAWDAAVEQQSGNSYGRGGGEPFWSPGQRSTGIDPIYMRRTVSYPSAETPGTIIVDPQNHFLYFIEGGGRAVRYGIGVGKQGFAWSGVATVHQKQEWPDWYPPKEMIQRKPELMSQISTLQSGLGVPGGPDNPLGARAMYLWQGNKDTLYRIHGTNEPDTIGRSVSSGCIRMLNQDVIDLYGRASVGAKVIVVAAEGMSAVSTTASGTRMSPRPAVVRPQQ